MPSIISIVGKSGSGKTTLIEKLIPVLKQRGYRIGTIKHAAHVTVTDKKGKDSWRHRAAGADTVVLASPGSMSMVKDFEITTLEDFQKYFDDVDLVITEGFKTGDKPKIEVFRSAAHKSPFCLDDQSLIAFVTDTPFSVKVPSFGLDDIEQLADLIEDKFLRTHLTVLGAS
jgi:molybdopterin-guanine dinucleotide biosynthesis protein B